MKNFFRILLGSILYPVVNIGPLLVPFLVTLLFYGGLTYTLVMMNIGSMVQGTYDFYTIRTLMNIIVVIAILLTLMPLLVGVTRHVIYSEKLDLLPVRNAFEPRSLHTIVAWLKVLIVYLIPLFVVGFAVVYMGGSLNMPVPDFGLNLGLNVGNLVLILGMLVALYFLARVSMAPITASLDKGASIRNSFKVTKHHGWLIFIPVLGLVALMCLLMWLVLYLTGGSGIMLDLDVFMALSHLGKLALIIELVAVRLLMTIVFVVALSELYVVISNRG
jgi:hypothetical protein